MTAKSVSHIDRYVIPGCISKYITTSDDNDGLGLPYIVGFKESTNV